MGTQWRFGKLVVGFGVLALLVAGGFWITHRSELTPEPELAILPQSAETAYLELDADGDGLKDWEEPIYRSDPNNPDTDGDSTLDGEEVATLRDPTRPPPDEVRPAGENSGNTDLGLLSQANLTQKFTQRLLETYIQERPSSTGGLDPNRLSSSLLNFLDQETPAVPSISPQDLARTATRDPAVIAAYLNRVADIVHQEVLRGNEETPLTLYASIIQRENFEDQLVRLDPFLEGTASAISALRAMTVPESWTLEHAELINHLLVIEATLRAMRASDQDILAVATLLTPYLSAQESLQALLGKTATRIQKEGIPVQERDPMGRLITLLHTL